MNFKTTYGLFAALLVMLGVAAIWLLMGPKPGDDTLLFSAARALKLETKDFDTFTIERKGAKPETLVFVRTGEKTWKLEKPIESRVDSAAVDRVIDDLLAARRDGAETKPVKLADVGLSDPSLVVKLSRKEGQSFTASFGNVTFGGANSQIYALSGDRPNAPLPLRRDALGGLFKSEGNEAGPAADLVKSAADFRSRDLLLAGAGFNPAENVKAVKLFEGKSEVALSRDADGSWKFDKPANYGAAEGKGDPSNPAVAQGPPAGVEPLLTALANIKPAGIDDIVDVAADFAPYGLDPGKETARFEIVRKNDQTESLIVGNRDAPSGKVFVRMAGDRAVAKVPANLIDPIVKLIARPTNLRDRQLLAFSPSGCDAVDIKIGGDARIIELRRVGEPASWRLFESDGSSQSANAATVRDLLAALGGRPVKDFPEANASDASLGFDRPAAEITLWMAGIIPEEKKDEAKDKAAPPKPATPTKPKLKDFSAKLIFGKRDKDLLFVRRLIKDKDGKETKADFAVSESLWPRVTGGRMEYVDPFLPSFVAGSVQKLSFNRGPEQFVIEKQDKAPIWIMKLPADRADRPADQNRIEQILADLSGLRAEKLWTEKPSERELERYGLKIPKLKAIVNLKDGDKVSDRVYSFGAETDDKSGVYAMQSERDLVFVVNKSALTVLEAGELQDPQIYRLDSTKVVGLKLTGWKDVVGQATTRELERKGADSWALKGEPNAKVSANQCNLLLHAVSAMRAEKFVVRKTGPKDEFKLAIPQGALEITINLEGEKDPVTLTIGGPEAGGLNYYATSSKAPGDVFLVQKGVFEAVKAKPAYFAAE